LSTVLQTPSQAVEWLRHRGAIGLHADSRRLSAGDAFLAWPGAASDGRRFVPAALAAGARACLVEHQASAQAGLDLNDQRIATYAGLKADASGIASAFYGHPSAQLQVMAVTGTNGKTSTAWWLAQALTAAGRSCALVGTLGLGQPGRLQSNGLTTPDPVLLQQHLRQWVEAGHKACAIEASSIGLAESRLEGLSIHTALFTNFTQDHLDYHGTMQAYWQAKARLFDWPGLRAAVINIDDPKGTELAGQLSGRQGLDVWTVSIDGPARLRAQDLRSADVGIAFEVVEGAQSCTVRVPAVGRYNVSNLLGVMAGLRSLGLSLVQAGRACADLTSVPGRMESLGGVAQPLVVVDYAHTPDALEQVLQALGPVADGRGGRLWLVVGCGGDRDRLKRPLMAAVGERHAQRLVLTSDNPRSELPGAILKDMVAGLQHAQEAVLEEDRARAIALAIGQAADADVVLVAGKGHEDYQEIEGQRKPFSDREVAARALRARASGAQEVAAC
jgi:UDP-N-acetylmuramoyl-L-alanyl-D-glutamate--2,6-diaminopimelate ligase